MDPDFTSEPELALHLLANSSCAASTSIAEHEGQDILEALTATMDTETKDQSSEALKALESVGNIELEARSLGSDMFYSSGAGIIESVLEKRLRKQGWSRAGPGRPNGSGRTLQEDNLQETLRLCLALLLRSIFIDCESMNPERQNEILLFPDCSNSEVSLNCAIDSLSQWIETLPTLSTERKSIWSLFPLMHCPAVLITISQEPRVMALNSNGCTLCRQGSVDDEKSSEINVLGSCEHVLLFNEILKEVSQKAGMELQSMLTIVQRFGLSVYGKKEEIFCCVPVEKGTIPRICYCVMKELPVSTNGQSSKATHKPVANCLNVTLEITRREVKSGRWRCCSENCFSVERIASCSHVLRSSNLLSQKGRNVEDSMGHNFGDTDGIFTRTRIAKSSEPDGVSGAENSDESSELNGYFDIVPSEEAVLLDLRLTKKAIELSLCPGDMSDPVIEAEPTCSFCHLDEGPSSLSQSADYKKNSTKVIGSANSTRMEKKETDVWIECDRACVSCKLIEYICLKCGRSTRESARTKGLVWVSYSTAYTELTMFRNILQIVLDGSSIGSLYNTREAFLSLQPNTSICKGPNTFRKALNIYAASRSFPKSLFRCSKCSDVDINGSIYYKQLSFDGLQVGYRRSKRKNAEQTSEAENCALVSRNDKAVSKQYIIQSSALRSILFESVRARAVPREVNSIPTLCSAVFNLNIKNQEMASSALEAIKIFDWKEWVAAITLTGMSAATSFTVTDEFRSVFQNVLDCRWVSRVLSVILCGLSSDLMKKIEPDGKEVLRNYEARSREFLNGLLRRLRTNKRKEEPVPQLVQISEVGITEKLRHIRPKYNTTDKTIGSNNYRWEGSVMIHDGPTFEDPKQQMSRSNYVTNEVLSRFQAKVRKSGTLSPRYDSTVKIILLMNAILNDPVCMWMRSESFDALNFATEALRKVNTTEDINSLSSAVRKHPASGLPIVCEGALAVAWSIESGNKDAVSSVTNLLLCIPRQHEYYLVEMVDRKQGASLPPGYPTPIEYEQKYFTDQVSSSLGKDAEHVSRDPSSERISELEKDRTGAAWDGDTFAPDFPRVRPAPMKHSKAPNERDADGSHVCVKNYRGQKAFTPGTFIAMCCCAHPKALGIINLKKPEGSRVPVNFIIQRCAVLPEAVIYDNSCKALASALGISAHVVEKTRFLIDRFHFGNHRACSITFHPDSHGEMIGRNTSSQEQRNSRLRPLQRSLREMTEENFKNFTVLAHAIHNSRAMYRDYLTASSPEGSHNGNPTGRKKMTWTIRMREMGNK